MKLQFKALVVILVLGLAAYTAYAENVTLSTYYPSPYGSYQTLETNILQGAAGTGPIHIVPNGGNVGIGKGGGATPPAPTSLLDIGNSTLANPAIVNVNAAAAQQTGLSFQSAGANNWFMYRPGSSTDLRFSSGGADRVTMTALGNVGIGVTPGVYKLNVTGNTNLNGTVSLVTNNLNAANELQVNCAGGLGCYAYAVYA